MNSGRIPLSGMLLVKFLRKACQRRSFSGSPMLHQKSQLPSDSNSSSEFHKEIEIIESRKPTGKPASSQNPPKEPKPVEKGKRDFINDYYRETGRPGKARGTRRRKRSQGSTRRLSGGNSNDSERLPNEEGGSGKQPSPVSGTQSKPTLLQLTGKTQVSQVQPLDHKKIPTLSHDLEKVLFSPGVHFLQDPRTKVFNFPEYLKKVVKYEEFNFDMIQTFISASKDETLLREAIRNNKTFYSSTSSMTSSLIQFYLFLNNYAPGESKNRFQFPRFSPTALRLPACVIVEPKGKNPDTGKTIFSVSSDKSADTEMLLGAMGHCMEALLTTEEEEFKKYLLQGGAGQKRGKRGSGDKPNTVNSEGNVYNYLAYGDFLMRSQLDCYNSLLPGNGTFDLKTRAVCAIRQDRSSDAANSTYQIWKQLGDHESFQREFDDLIRTGALLKYGFQARIGQMDGIYVAYHNLNQFFGFQYLPLSEIDRIFFTDTTINAEDVKRKMALAAEQKYRRVELPISDNISTKVADRQFKASLDIWLDILHRAVKDLACMGFSDAPFRLVLKMIRPKGVQEPQLRVYVVPLNKSLVGKLEKFPNNFRTSFKEKISPEERVTNLNLFKAGLDRINEEIVSEKPVLGYGVNISHYINGRKSTQVNAYPRNGNSDWRMKYLIWSSPGNVLGDKSNLGDKPKTKYQTDQADKVKMAYLRLMKDISSMLTSSMLSSGGGSQKVQSLRYFSGVGKKRLEEERRLTGGKTE